MPSAYTNFAQDSQLGWDALSRGLGQLGRGIEQYQQRETLAEIGKGVADPSTDFRALAGRAIAGGQPQLGAALLDMADKQAGVAATTQAGRDLAALAGGGQPPAGLGALGIEPPAAPRAPRAPSFAATSGPAGSYLDTLIGKESSGDPNARNPNSTATGLGQFTAGTWENLRRTRPDLGLTPDGRTDPDQSKRATLALAEENGKVLASAGHDTSDGNLYVAHFLGAGGATRFLNGLRTNPNAPAASYVQPDQAAANRQVFYNPDGSPKTAGQVYSQLTSRFGRGRTAEADMPVRGGIEAGGPDTGQGFASPAIPGRDLGRSPQVDARAVFEPGQMAPPNMIAPPSTSRFGGGMAIDGEVLPPIVVRDQGATPAGRGPVAARSDAQVPLPPRRPTDNFGNEVTALPGSSGTPADYSNTRDAGARAFWQTGPGMSTGEGPGILAILDNALTDTPLPTGPGGNAPVVRAAATDPAVTGSQRVAPSGAAPSGQGVSVPGYPGTWTPESAAAARARGEEAPGERAFANAQPATSPTRVTGSPSTWQTPSEVPQPFQKMVGRADRAKLFQIIADPRVGAGMKEIAKMYLAKELNENDKLPETVKAYMWARANNETGGLGYKDFTDRNRPEHDPAAKIAAETSAREQEARRMGLDTSSPEGRRFVLTGTLPAESMDRKAIQEADASITAAHETIGSLREAKALSAKAYDGAFASGRGQFMANFGSEGGQATMMLDNVVQGAALNSLKSIFGGNPTEGERKVLLDVAGSANQPQKVRDVIFDRAIAAAERRLKLNQQKAEELRGGSYYKPGGGQGAQQGQGPQARAPQMAPQDRFGQLAAQGLSKQDAYARMAQEGY